MRSHLEAVAGESIPRLGGVLEFMRLLWAVDHGLQRASKAMQRRIGLTGPQRLALRILGRFPAISAGRLARILHLHASTLTGVLARLEERKLVRRWADARDGRRTLLSLTDEGRTLDIDQEATIESRIGAALARLSQEDIRAAERVLLAVGDALVEE